VPNSCWPVFSDDNHRPVEREDGVDDDRRDQQIETAARPMRRLAALLMAMMRPPYLSKRTRPATIHRGGDPRR